MPQASQVDIVRESLLFTGNYEVGLEATDGALVKRDHRIFQLESLTIYDTLLCDLHHLLRMDLLLSKSIVCCLQELLFLSVQLVYYTQLL